MKMKTTGKNTHTRNIFIVAAMVLMMFTFSSCATKAIFLSSAVVPAAEGIVTVKEDGNKNFVIKIQTTNLADSQRLTPPKNVYVVWMVTDNNITKNIGQIISSSGTLSSKLKASFETVSSFRPTKIFITAENEANIQYPFSEVVLTTDFIVSK
jgi:hypothetical protein